MTNRYLKKFAAMALALCACACSLTGGDDDDDTVAALTLEADTYVITADGNSAAQLIVKYGDEEVREGIKFYLVGKDGTNKALDVPALLFFTETPGNYTIWCSYKAQLSNKITVSALSQAIPLPGLPEDSDPMNLNFRRRVFVNQFTGTGCGYCPYVIAMLRNFAELSAYKDLYVLAAVHTYNANDPMYLDEIDNLARVLGIQYYPSICLDMRPSTVITNSGALATVFEGTFVSEYNEISTNAGLCASVATDNGQCVVKAGIKAGVNGKYRVAAWMLEDGIEAVQNNVGAAGDFSIHNNAVRAIAGCNPSAKDYSGTEVALSVGESASFDFAFNVAANVNTENVHVAVYVSEKVGTSWMVTNVIDVRPGESRGFEYEK